ncbi:cornifelin [Strongylocentrotus purpuratus]|uniref:Cornifelin homolog n=1 Tax=Strongylocentrotus purpuratus TaxID=7668 RepID=A0A7M7GEV5_STRPU|nr:cornifelin [Strongylocentrotus purpuratus]|eukprot:XP_003724503.1 PREDICTED: cornifelin [Strongylocentrotus purpuratus]
MDPSQQQAIIQQPVTTVQMTTISNPLMPRGGPREWNSGIFECFNDIPICLCGLFLGTCYQCCVSTEMGEHCCVPICTPGALGVMRAQIRGRHNIRGTLMNDCCMTTFCGPCTLCQLSREVQDIKSGKAQV